MNTQSIDSIIAIQVVPVIEPNETAQDQTVTVQFEGPTEETTGWAVYYRHQSSKVQWVADSEDEESAMIVGRELAQQEGVQIEAQPWK